MRVWSLPPVLQRREGYGARVHAAQCVRGRGCVRVRARLGMCVGRKTSDLGNKRLNMEDFFASQV